jgi:hypothetical protein
MKQNPEFILYDVAGNHVLMPIGHSAVSLDGIVNLNDMGAALWEKLSGETSYSDLLQYVVSRYEVGEETADADLKAFLDVLRKAGAIIE